MAINFTDSPADGATQVIGGRTYTYNSAKNKWDTTATEVVGPTATVYATVDNLPGTATTGDQAFVSGTNRLYIWNGSGWYNIALINTNPTISGVSSSYALATDGTATVITITATDPEGLPITYSIASDTSGNIATVTQGTGASINVFTITPSTNNANGGTFSLTFRASDGVNIATAPASFTLQFSVENSKYTTALITSVGANLAVNNTFVDSSTSSHTITAAGNATQTTFSPYRHGGYSTYFDGSGDYLQAPAASVARGTGNWTIECWAYFYSLGTTNIIWDARTGATPTDDFLSVQSDGSFRYRSNGITVSAAGVVTTGVWHHIAQVLNNGTLKTYVDGTEVASSSQTSNLSHGAALTIGGSALDNANWCNANFADFRVVLGTAVYTSNFTPPTERLTAIANTSLLTCHLPYIADGSTNGHAITVAGNTKTVPFAPYDHQEYSSNSHGGSMYFDGSGDYLQVSNSTNFDFPSDFTIEFWIKFDNTSWPTYIDITGNANNYIFIGSGRGGWVMRVNSNTSLSFSYQYNSSWVFEDVFSLSSGLNLNQWYHIAFTRESSSLKCFLNGTQVGSTITNSTNIVSGEPLAIGTGNGNPAVFNGSISDYRIVQGTAVYTSDFTPPTAPLTDITNTSLLVSGTNAGIIDKSQSNKFLTLSGDAKSSTTQSKYLSSSIYFDGSGDNILTDVMTTNGDFTVEMWIRFDGSVANPASQSPTFFVWGTTTFMLYCTIANNTMQMIGNGSGLISGSTTISADTWYHVAFARQGNTGRLFVDGNLEGSTTSFTTDLNARAVIGSEENAGYPAKAYMSDVRVTKGLARYTANFTPPTAALQG